MKKTGKREEVALSCPISLRYIDSNMVRLISLQVALFSIALIYFVNEWFAYILLWDYIARFFRINFLSPFYIVAKGIINIFSIEEKMGNEAPKRFALQLGLGISIFISAGVAFELYSLFMPAVIILFICSMVETLFDFCVGCKMYYMLQLGTRFYKKGDY